MKIRDHFCGFLIFLHLLFSQHSQELNWKNFHCILIKKKWRMNACTTHPLRHTHRDLTKWKMLFCRIFHNTLCHFDSVITFNNQKKKRRKQNRKQGKISLQKKTQLGYTNHCFNKKEKLRKLKRRRRQQQNNRNENQSEKGIRRG